MLARAASWLVAPADWPDRAGPGSPRAAPWARPSATRPAVRPDELDPPRPVLAILGLAPRAGASTIARAVAAVLAGFDPGRAAVLHTADPPRTRLATAAAARMARAVGASCEARAAGRLCVVGGGEPLPPLAAMRAAPLVADVGHGEPAEAAVALADHVAVVAPADVEPALLRAVEVSLREGGASISTVLSRMAGEPPPGLEHVLVVPEARVAAQLTLACREPIGALVAIATELAERSLAEVWR